MVKYFVLLFNLVGLLIFNFFTNDVTVTITAPAEVPAGTEFTIELVISKGSVSGLGRFQQDLPEGITAIADNNAQLSNADFKFQYQKVRMMWLLLPADETFTIKYTIQVSPTFQGKLKLGGQFVYLKDNVRMPVEIPEQIVNITPGTGVATFTVPSDSVKSAKTDVSILPLNRQVYCLRQKPEKTEANDALIINLKISKDMANNYAKIQDEIPKGFKAEAIETKGAVFTFKDKTAKFLWMNLPADSTFMVSYKLIPEDKYVSMNDVALNGSFSFLEDEKTYSISIKNQGEQIIVKNTDKKYETVAEKKYIEMLKKEEGKPDKKTKKDKEKKKEKEDSKQLASVKNTNSTNSIEGGQKGVIYKVQLAAGHAPINTANYFRNLKINDKVSTEQHAGWRKYTIGAFPQYQAARDQRVFVWGNTPITDAFVSAYNDGNRITVQEALMIVSQKWMK